MDHSNLFVTCNNIGKVSKKSHFFSFFFYLFEFFLPKSEWTAKYLQSFDLFKRRERNYRRIEPVQTQALWFM